jgi:ferredoxin-type protein NapH
MQHIITVIRLLFLGLFIFLLAKGKLMLWFALFAVSLVVALIFGRIYCGYVCPMNTLMIPTEWIAKKLKLQTNIAPKWLKDRNYTWVALASSVAIMIFSKRLLSINIPILPIWLIISILVTLRYKPAVFHNLICPFGTLQKACGKFARIAKIKATTRLTANKANHSISFPFANKKINSPRNNRRITVIICCISLFLLDKYSRQ